MSPDTIQPTPWGESEIRGPVHLFRERLLLRQFLEMMEEGGRILDAGCGSGSLAMDLQREGFRVDGIEHSAQFVEMVRHKAARYGSESRVRVQQGSVTQLPFESEVFDGAVCGEVLEHVLPEDGGDTQAVAELHRVLRPEAPVVVSVPLNPKLWDASDEWAGHVKRYRRAELVELLEAAGFAIHGVRTWGFPLGRIYHKLLFGPWVKKTASMGAAEKAQRKDTRAAANRQLVEAVASLFRVDELFSRTSLGRGIIVSARKR
jgi:2-polyprenyl-3-methyl-5-hydroxy-6-metoxy-1,4-benzoquinol methylase